MTDPRTKIVGEGYDAMADTWEEWSSQIADDARGTWRDRFLELLPEGARVVELGCGNGTRETRLLAQKFRLTGVDLSAEQLRRARERVPDAEFVQADLTSLELEPASLDGVVSFYVFNHVPRDLLPQLLTRIRRWLQPGGYFMAALGASDLPDWYGDFLGAPSFFSGHEPDTNRALVRAAGFELVDDEVVTIQEPEGPVNFHWVLARR